MGNANLPKSFWGYALETIVYILNRVLTKSVEVTPYEVWTNKKPHLSHMKVWGYPAYVKQTVSDKLEVKSNKCLFAGFPKETIEYQFYNTLEQKVVCFKACCFLEKDFLLREASASNVKLGEVQDAFIDASHLGKPKDVIHENELVANPSKAQAFRRISRICTLPKRYGFLISEQKEVLLIKED